MSTKNAAAVTMNRINLVFARYEAALCTVLRDDTVPQSRREEAALEGVIVEANFRKCRNLYEMAGMIGMTAAEFADCADGKESFTVPDMERMCEFLGVAWHLFQHPERAVDINDWRRRHGKKAR